MNKMVKSKPSESKAFVIFTGVAFEDETSHQDGLDRI